MQTPATILISLFLLWAGLTPVQGQQPTATFSANSTQGCPPLTVAFQNNSVNATGYFWDFGNGNTSTLAQPVNSYTTPGNYTVTLIASDNNGQADTLVMPQFVAVHTPPNAALTVVNASACANGTAIQFQNNSTNANTYTWNFGDGSTSSQVSPQHQYAQSGTFSVSLIASSAQGCTDVAVAAQAVTIHPQPDPGFTADTTTVCDSTYTIQFQAIDLQAVQWNWTFGDGTTGTGASPAHAYGDTGSYTVALTVVNAVGCSDSLNVPDFITLNAPFTPDFSVADPQGCAPFATTFSYTNTGISQASWSFGDGTTSSAHSPQKTYTTPGQYAVALALTDAQGCTFRDTVPNLVQVLDTPVVAFQAATTAGCVPLSVAFVNQCQQASSYQWYFGDSATSTQPAPQHTYQASGQFSVALVATHANGCKDSLGLSSFITAEAAQALIGASDTTGCAPQPIHFTAQTAGLQQWSWQFGDGHTDTVANPQHTYAANGSYTVTLAVESPMGCRDTTTIPGYIQLAPPVVNFTTPPPIVLCGPGTVGFNGNGISNGPWLWDFGDGTTSTQAAPGHQYNQPGTYTVSLVTQNAQGCALNIPTYNTVVVSAPVAHFGLSVDNCPDFEVTFTDSSTGAVEWLWDFGNGQTDTAQHPVHQYNGSGNYQIALTVTDSLGCQDTRFALNAVYLLACNGNAPVGGSIPIGGGPGGPGPGNLLSQPVSGCVPYTVDFFNPLDSVAANTWHFGDGDSSTLLHPSHTYLQAGIYSITLSVQFQNGTSQTWVIDSVVRAGDPQAHFGSTAVHSCQGTTILFSDSSQHATQSHWDFGDGQTSTATNPAHAYAQAGNYSVNLTVSDSLGCTNLTARNVTSGLLQPGFTYDREVCRNDTVHFGGTIPDYAGYLWDFGDGQTDTARYPSHVYDTVGTFPVAFYLVDTAGCLDTVLLPDSVTVLDPVPQLSLPNGNEGCAPFSAALQNQSLGADQWTWIPGNGDTLHTQHATVNYSQPGPYSITLIARKGNCTAQRTFTDTILVHQAVAGFSAVQVNDCLPVQASFTDQSAGAVAWAWDFGDSTQQNGQHPQHTYAAPPAGPVVLSIIDSNGCTDTATANPLQFFTPTVQLSTQSGCVPLAVQFSDATGSAVNCIWDFGDGNTAQTLAASHTYSQAGTYTVSLLAQSAQGCWDTVMASNPVVVEGSHAAFDTVGQPGFCAPLPIQFQNQSANAQSWAWDFGDGAQSTLEHPAHVYVQAGQYTVSLIATSPLGCTDTAVQPAFIKASGPMADLAVSDTNACQPVDVQFTDLSAHAVSWEWYFGDGAVSYQQHPVHTYQDPGTYSISLLARDSLGCTEYRSFEFITVHATPEAAFSMSSTTACLGTPVVYTNASEHLDSASHAWNLGGGITSAARDTTVTYVQPGPFDPVLIVTNPSGCADTAQATQTLTVYDTAAAQQQGLYYATVESDSTIEVHWPANTQSNFARYRLFRQNLWRTFDQLDSISNPTVTYVSDHNRPNDYQPSCYRIMTEAHCAAPPHPDSLTTYCTMHLDAFAQTRANLLRWTAYVGCPVAGYAIQRQFSATDPFQTIATVPAGTLSYSDSAELCPATYRYRILATGLCGTQHTSASNERTLTPLKSVVASQQTAVIRTTVEHNQAILTEWKAPEISPQSVRYYDLLRAEGGGPFELLVRLPAGVYSYLDEQVYPQNYAYTYKIRVVNHCDIPTQAGSIGTSILLKASTRDYAATLNWSRYEAWESGVETYVIERQDALGNWQRVKRVNGNTHRTVILLTEGE